MATSGNEGANRPEDITRLFVERANAGDAEGLAALYEPDAVVAYPPGAMTSGRVAALAWPVVSMLAELDQRSQAANIPLVLPQAMLPIGFLLMAFLVAVRLIVPRATDANALERSDP